MMTDLDDTLTAFFGSDLDDQTVASLAGYLEADGILVFNTGALRRRRPVLTSRLPPCQDPGAQVS